MKIRVYFHNFSISLYLFQNKKVNNNCYSAIAENNRDITVSPTEGQELKRWLRSSIEGGVVEERQVVSRTVGGRLTWCHLFAEHFGSIHYNFIMHAPWSKNSTAWYLPSQNPCTCIQRGVPKGVHHSPVCHRATQMPKQRKRTNRGSMI